MDWPRLVDPNLRTHLGRYIAQSLMAAVAILLVSLSLDILMDGIIVSSLGASTFIVFAMPSSRPARARALVGGYALGTLWGVVLALVWQGLFQDAALCLEIQYLLGAAAVGTSLFSMVATQCEHPPAAGLALGYVLAPWSASTPLVVMIAVSLLALTHYLLRRVLIDLH